MIMVPPRARFVVLPIAFYLAARLNGAFCIRGVIVVGTKHFSSPLERDNAWLHVTAYRAAVESPELITAVKRKLGRD
jgi:hypothetical protein